MGVFFGWVFFQPFNKSFSSALVFFLRVFLLGVFFGAGGLPGEHGCSVILEQPMSSTRRRKCRHCKQLYDPDPRNRYHQRHCGQPSCRRASKAASQQRWRASPKGRDYFRGPANRLRVQAWRRAHPGYWRKRGQKSGALQDHCLAQVLLPAGDKVTLTPRALQDLLHTQGLALTGLVAQLRSRENIN